MSKFDKALNVISTVCLVILAFGTIMDIACVISEWAWYKLRRSVENIRCDSDSDGNLDPDAPDFEPGF